MVDSPAPHFDIGEKLSQRLNEHTQERNLKQHVIDQGTVHLQNLIKSTPKRPRESKPALQDKIKKLEKDRTSRSLPLSQEKALLREIGAAQKAIRQHDQCESHQELIRRKRAEIESAREALRITQSSIAEIEKVLATVQLAKRLGCTTAELITREVSCPVDKVARVLIKAGDTISNAEKNGVHIHVDKMHGKFVIKGSEKAVMQAVKQIEDLTTAIDLEFDLSSDHTLYLLSQSSVLEKIKSSNAGVEFDFLARMNRIVMHGPPDNVDRAKADLSNLCVVSKSRGLDSKQISLVVGKTGETIHGLSQKHAVVMDVSKAGDASTLRVIGTSDNVEAALSEVESLLFDNEQIEESLNIDSLMKGELINNSGASIKEFQHSVSNAVAAGNGLLLFLDRNASKDSPTLTIKCARSVMERAKSLVKKKIHEFESKIVTVSVPVEIIPTIIGKGGSKISSLRQTGAGAAIEADKSGVVKIYSHDAETRDAVKSAIEKIVAENQTGHVALDSKGTLGILFGDQGKEVMSQISELGCNLSVSDDDTKLIIKGTEENIAKISEILKPFLAKNYIVEIDVHSDDAALLFMGGAKSVLQNVESKHNVKASLRKEKGTLLLRGERDSVHCAKKEIEYFLYGGEGLAVCKFKVPEDAIGIIVGKGGSNLVKLESDFEGVRIHVPKDKNIVSIRGPEELVKKCRVRLVTDIATMRIVDNIEVSSQQHDDLSHSDIIKKIASGTNTSITLNEGSIKIRGISNDVRDAKALFVEHFTGSYSGLIDLGASQCSRLKSTIAKDSSHFERIKLSTGTDVSLDESESCIKVTGKKASVKKAKLSLIGFLDFLLPKQFQTVKVHKTLFKSMGDPEKLAEIAAATGAFIYLDRDLVSIIIRSESPDDDSAKALELVNARLAESEKLNYVFRLVTSDAWLLPIIIGKGGQSVKKIEAETGCTIDIFKDELTVVVRADSEEAVDLGKDVLEAIVSQARKECVFIDMPDSAIPAFVGKGGVHIKQFGADYDVEIERVRKQSSTIKITGKELAVAKAKEAVLSWMNEWEASHTGLTITVEEQFIPAILGKGGETVKAIQKSTGCKIDIDRQHNTVTVREGTESNRATAMTRVKAIIDEERATAAERAAEKEKLRLEQAEIARCNVKSPVDTTEPSPEGAVNDSSRTKDRSKEFLVRPVGSATSKSKGNGSTKDAVETGTKEGRDLYLMLVTGNESTDDQDDQWDSSTVSSSAAMISACDSNDGESELHYHSISGFTVRI
ncbi:hypothetical protein ACHAWX_004971 [Stephanocyclus meneghinianus]